MKKRLAQEPRERERDVMGESDGCDEGQRMEEAPATEGQNENETSEGSAVGGSEITRAGNDAKDDAEDDEEIHETVVSVNVDDIGSVRESQQAANEEGSPEEPSLTKETSNIQVENCVMEQNSDGEQPSAASALDGCATNEKTNCEEQTIAETASRSADHHGLDENESPKEAPATDKEAGPKKDIESEQEEGQEEDPDTEYDGSTELESGNEDEDEEIGILEPNVSVLDEHIDDVSLASREEDIFEYNRHNESIFDDERIFPGLKANSELVSFADNGSGVINHATLKALIVQLTSPEVVDYNLICDFFLTYRVFVSSEDVMVYLLTRLVWSLQYINSQQESKVVIGKSTLLRTFVVLRHWIINYFHDDFFSNFGLCELFVNNLNEITNKSHLLNDVTIFEKKIVSDLKVHWISQIDEFCNTNIRGDLASGEILHYLLPRPSAFNKFKRLPKSTTNMSIHTNPSFRRSAMLSLYDQGVHHKCIIYDESNSDNENPQVSINNLFSHHSSNRLSLDRKIKQYNAVQNTSNDGQRLKKKAILKSVLTHNHLNLKDSSLALKQISHTTRKSSNNYGTLLQAGFATNGGLRLPNLNAGKIRPPTPAKKMDYSLTEILPAPSKGADMTDENGNTDVGRKKSLRKMVDGWRKPFNGKNNDVENNSEKPINSDKKDEEAESGRYDILSARIVDELEFLIRNYIIDDNSTSDARSNGFLSVDIDSNSSHVDINSIKVATSPNRKVQLRIQRGTISKKREDEDRRSDAEDQMDINDISELNFKKIDGIFNLSDEANYLTNNSDILKELNKEKDKDLSFQEPASINWNDESNFDFENTAMLEADSEEKSDVLLSRGNAEVTHTNNNSHNSSISSPSNLSEYRMDVADLGIAVSPTSKRQSSMKRLTFSERDPNRRSEISISEFSTNLKRDSIKSYLSYDSAFSLSNNSKLSGENGNNGNLRKKHGFQNLRTIAGLDGDSPEKRNLSRTMSSMSVMSRSSSIRRSIRYSTLNALSELPFNSSKRSNTLNVNSVIRESTRSSGMADSSIFSVAIKSQKLSSRIENDLANISDDSLTNSVAIPGISNYVLKELAAIPDESFSSNDPVEVALYKLEGRNSKGEVNEEHQYNSQVDESLLNDAESDKAKSISKLHVPVDERKDVRNSHPTQNSTDILEEINNANTKDVISLDASGYTDVQPLRPGRVSDDTQPSDSSIDRGESLKNTLEMTTSNVNHTSAKLILDGYSFSTNTLMAKHVIENNTHVSFALSFESKTLAEHFTLIERDILQEIDWKDLIEHKWSHTLTPVNSWLDIIVSEEYFQKNKGVNLVIARFNLMVNWIISEVLLTNSQQERIDLISRFIHVAENCLVLQNYSTLMQIILALTSEKVQKLKGTWRNVYPGDILMLKSLEELASPLKNFLNYRLRVNNITPSKGCIPFLALYLSDLTFNAERPAIIKNKSPKSNANLGDSSSTLVSGETEPMINFSKFRTSVHIVKSLSQLIEWSSNYHFTVDHSLLSKCLYVKSLDEDEMNICASYANDY